MFKVWCLLGFLYVKKMKTKYNFYKILCITHLNISACIQSVSLHVNLAISSELYDINHSCCE